mmetsp:Transcript_130/g.136  ORF Transcript_130/g.136 Transcript_130/m.136 type:complete len:155 (+) Transcript_130:40-504(+)|eukprot:jgi/Bigna1/64522/fgenesh1_kg.78_\
MIRPHSLAVKTQPPVISLLYRYGKDEKLRLHHFDVNITSKSSGSDLDAEASKLLRSEYFKNLKTRQVLRMLRKLKEGMEGGDKEEKNLNTVSESELRKAKEAMNVDFVKNKVGSDHPDFEYDKQVDFGPAEDDNDWDDDHDPNMEDDFDDDDPF